MSRGACYFFLSAEMDRSQSFGMTGNWLLKYLFYLYVGYQQKRLFFNVDLKLYLFEIMICHTVDCM